MFYDKFKILCDKKGVSCNKAATDMGLSNSTPTKWKKTGATPDSKTLSRISSYFGVSIGELLTNESTGAIELQFQQKGSRVICEIRKKHPPKTVSAKSATTILNLLFSVAATI